MPTLTTKAQAMKAVIEGRAHESFEHSIEGIFDITLMRQWAKDNAEIVYVDISEVAPHIHQSRVIEQERVAGLSIEGCLADPAMVVVYERGGTQEHLYVDGHHRCIRLERDGYSRQPVYLVPEYGIIRPPLGFTKSKELDWGDAIVHGEIVKRT